METTAVGHSLRDLVEGHGERPAQGDGEGRSRRAAGSVRGDRAVGYDYLVFGIGAEVDFFGTAGAPEHAFPMYTLPQACG